MKPPHKKFITLAVLIIISALAIWYIKSNLPAFKQLSFSAPHWIIIAIILLILNYFLIGIVTKELLRPLKVILSNKESFQLSVITGFYNLITPFRGGMAARAVYLKKKHNFPYTNFLATLAASYVLIFLVGSFLGIASALLIYWQTNVMSWILLFVFLAVFFPLLGIIIFSPKFPETKYNFMNRFIKVANGWHLIKNNKRIILVTTGLTFVQIIISSLMLYLQFRVFGIEINFVNCLFLSAIANISLLISITPANLGIQEAIIVFSASTIGITPAQSLSAALLGRAISMVILFILGPIFSYKLLKKKGLEKEVKEENDNEMEKTADKPRLYHL